MEERLPNAAYQNSYWSGYEELSYFVHDNRRRSIVQSLPGAAGYIAIPVAYVLSLALVLSLSAGIEPFPQVVGVPRKHFPDIRCIFRTRFLPLDRDVR